MSGQTDRPNSRKRKSMSEVRVSTKETTTKKRCVKSSQKKSSPESSSTIDCGYSQTGGSRSRGSFIICECHRSPGRTRCSESPEPEGLEGKENNLRTRLDWDDCSGNIGSKRDSGNFDMKDTSAAIFPDDDSNQILPIEQFFGNLDVVPDLSQESSEHMANRRRQFYARADSDEDEARSSCAPQHDTGGAEGIK